MGVSEPREIFRLGASGLGKRIATGELTATQVVELHIERIEAVNATLNAVVVKRYDMAREEARSADERRARGEPLGPLHGVPITIKECLDVVGLPSTFGVTAHRNDIATADDPYVARLRQAGAIVLGKTNVAQLLLFLETDNPLYGRTQNPCASDRSSGGSSGGEGAIIAACGSPLGLGTDIGGSSRIPAAFSGIVGFKPTAGRLPDRGRGSVPFGQRAIPSQIGVLAREVRDVVLGLTVANGGRAPDDGNPRPLGDPSTVDVSKLRVGYFTDDSTFAPCAAAVRAVREAAALLAERGATVVPFSPPDVAHATELFYGVLSADGGRGMLRFLAGSPQDPRIALILSAVTASALKRAMLRALLRLTGRRKVAELLGVYGRYDTSHYWDLVEALDVYQRRFLSALDAGDGGPLDVLLSPGTPLPAVRHGASAELGVLGGYTAIYNVLGYPAGVVPFTRVRADEETKTVRSSEKMDQTALETERGSAGLPIGVQIAARPWRDHVALAVMAAIESAVDPRV